MTDIWDGDRKDLEGSAVKETREPLGRRNKAKVDETRQRFTGTSPLDVAAFQSFAD